MLKNVHETLRDQNKSKVKMAAGVVVWEWQNEFGNWRPYSPQISAFLESNKSSITPLSLGMVDPMLYLYSIDVQNLWQTRQGTGGLIKLINSKNKQRQYIGISQLSVIKW